MCIRDSTSVVLFKAGFVHPDVILFIIKHCPIGVHSTNENPLEANMFWLDFLNLSFEFKQIIKYAVCKSGTISVP